MNNIRPSKIWYLYPISAITFIVLAITIGLIINTLATKPHIISTQANIVAIVSISLTIIIGTIVSFFSFTKEKKGKKLESLSLERLTELQNHRHFKLDNQQSLELLKRALSEKLTQIEKEMQEAQQKKEKFKLEKQQQNIKWQVEAIGLTEYNPSTAIILAWLAIEQEIQNTINRLDLPNSLGKGDASLSMSEKKELSTSTNIQLLVSSKVIDQDTLSTLQLLRALRNRVVSGKVEKEEISKAVSIFYVQNAIPLAEKFSLLEETSLASSESDRLFSPSPSHWTTSDDKRLIGRVEQGLDHVSREKEKGRKSEEEALRLVLAQSSTS